MSSVVGPFFLPVLHEANHVPPFPASTNRCVVQQSLIVQPSLLSQVDHDTDCVSVIILLLTLVSLQDIFSLLISSHVTAVSSLAAVWLLCDSTASCSTNYIGNIEYSTKFTCSGLKIKKNILVKLHWVHKNNPFVS